MSALKAEYAINLLSGLYSSLLPRWLYIWYPLVSSKIILRKLRRVVVRKCSPIFFINGRCSKLEEYIISKGQNLYIVDIVLKYVNLSIIWHRKIQPFTVLYIAIPTSLEQYSIILIICSLMFVRRPAVFCRLFLQEPLEFTCQLYSLPPEGLQFMFRLDNERPVLGIGATEDVCLRIEDSRRIEGVLSFMLYFIVFSGVILLLD